MCKLVLKTPKKNWKISVAQGNKDNMYLIKVGPLIRL